MRPLTQFIFPLLAVALVASSSVFGQHVAPTLETTARGLYLSENLEVDLTSPEIAKEVAVIKAELEAVFDTYVRTSAQSAFYGYEPFQAGRISVRLSPSLSTAVESKLDADGKLDVTQPIGIPELDALNAQWKIQTYEKRSKWTPSLTLYFNPDQNPHPVAEAFKAVPGTKYAVPNYLSYIGGGTELRRLKGKSHSRNRQPAVYVLTIGWGDCPAGCMALHRSYFEIGRTRTGGVTALKIGEMGTPLSDEDRNKYYK